MRPPEISKKEEPTVQLSGTKEVMFRGTSQKRVCSMPLRPAQADGRGSGSLLVLFPTLPATVPPQPCSHSPRTWGDTQQIWGQRPEANTDTV